MDYKFTIQIQNQGLKVFPTMGRAIQYVREVDPLWYQLDKVGPDGYRETIISASDSRHV